MKFFGAMQPYAAPLLEDLEQALEEFDCLVTLKSNDRFFPVWSVAYASSHSLLLTLNADRVYLSYLYVEKLFNCRQKRYDSYRLFRAFKGCSM